MSETILDTPRKILAFDCVVELATGLALIVDPAIVARLLLGADLFGLGIVIGRCFGIAVIALGLACWPSSGSVSAPLRAMLTYNALIGLYLAYLGTVGHMSALLLWPAVALHVVLALLFASPRLRVPAPRS